MKNLESKERREERMNLIRSYMGVERQKLTPKVPVIAMLNIMDVKASKKFSAKPFDDILLESLEETCKYLCVKIQECKMGYIHSGLTEISLLISDLNRTDTWLNYDIQKVVSFISATASTFFNYTFDKKVLEKKEAGNMSVETYEKYLKRPVTLFNVVIFNIDIKDVSEYFIGKQYESINYSMHAIRKFYLKNSKADGKSLETIEQELLDEKSIVWDDMSNHYKYGVAIERVEFKVAEEIRHKWIANRNIQLYLEEKSYIEKCLSE